MLPPWSPGVVEAEEAVKAEPFRVSAGQAHKTQTFRKVMSNTAEVRMLRFAAAPLYLAFSTPC